MAEAVFQGTFAQVKPIAGRKVYQFIIEVPMERADAALKAMGGLPNPEESRWVAVARLDPKVTEQKPEAPAEGATAPQTKAKRTPSQRAYLLCDDKGFWRYLNDQLRYGVDSSIDAAEAMRELCDVGSRAEFDIEGSAAQKAYLKLESEFKAWAGRTP